MRKIIFLDIDGVLNGHEKLESGYCGIRHRLARRLNRILDAVPDCHLVISSAWRYMTYRGDMSVAGFEYLLLVHGVKCHGRVAGVTEPDPVDAEPCHFDAEAWRTNGLRWRAEQIQRYLIKNPAAAYVVLDDLPLSIERLVQTNGATGLTQDDADRAIRILVST